jgi:Coatomer beta subunit appendage platform
MPVQQNVHHCNWLCRSVFGEDALVNVSVEKQADGKLAGFIRIRSKTQVRASEAANMPSAVLHPVSASRL